MTSAWLDQMSCAICSASRRSSSITRPEDAGKRAAEIMERKR